jgi:hypothetical protein
MTRQARFSQPVNSPFQFKELKRIHIALWMLYGELVPGSTLGASEMQTLSNPISVIDFLRTATDQKSAVKILGEKGLAEIATLAFLFGDAYFDLRNMMIERDYQNEVVRVVHHEPAWPFYEYTKQFSPLLKKPLPEQTMMVVSDGIGLVLPQLSSHFLAWNRDPVVAEKCYTLNLKLLLMPMVVLYSYFSMHLSKNTESAIFIASQLAYENKVMLDRLAQSSEFLAWFFCAPHERIALCISFKKHRKFLNSHAESLEEIQIKTLLVLAKPEFERRFAELDVLLNGQMMGAYTEFLAIKKSLEEALNPEEFYDLSWVARGDLFYEKCVDALCFFDQLGKKTNGVMKDKVNDFSALCRRIIPADVLYVKESVSDAIKQLDILMVTLIDVKKRYQAAGVDWYAVLLPMKDFFDRWFQDQTESWSSKKKALHEKIDFILFFFEHFSLVIDRAVNDQLNGFIAILKNTLPANFDRKKIEKSGFVSIEKDDVVQISSLVQKFCDWMVIDDQKNILRILPLMEAHYYRVYREFLDKPESTSSKLLLNVSNSASSWLSFLPRMQSTERMATPAQFSEQDFEEMHTALLAINTPLQLQRFLMNLFAHEQAECVATHKKFITALILDWDRERVSREVFSASHYQAVADSAVVLSCGPAEVKEVCDAFLQRVRASVGYERAGATGLSVEVRSLFQSR